MDMDSQFTADRSYVCAFFPSQNLSCLPHNIDDQDMVGHQLPAVSDQRTVSLCPSDKVTCRHESSSAMQPERAALSNVGADANARDGTSREPGCGL